ncbi:hypothetical protein [Campylobacter sp. CNRCH_2016_0050h]|uniref:hypothetical protein n=1 Tax=Campylobacter sp. CNRCH_2016_0050h TaxID=2911608 RepID=UPI0021E64AED|nr:hypothetical protein [Campylobacter sp. CNRCH_2016_0050h]MCV3457100.1 hypothetical protein [Campylobacter sp. CNRCH_2016_0050h]
MNKISLDFEEIKYLNSNVDYTETCSGDRSDCCTRVCTRHNDSDESSLDAWSEYLEVVSGVVQY